MSEQRRRTLLKSFGTAATIGLSGLAGCAGQSGDGSTETTASAGTATDSTATETDAETTVSSQTITDMAGREVTVPATVERTIGLGSGALRMLTYLDAVDTVVGVETLETQNEKRPYRPYVLANEELTDRTPIGSRKSPDTERMLQQKPDVVFWAWAKQKKADDLQSKLGVPVVVVNPGDLTPNLQGDVFETLRTMGSVLGSDERAKEVVSYTKETVADLESRTPSGDGPRSYIGYLGRGKHGLTYTQPLYPPFNLVGATNVVSGIAEDDLKKKKGAARTTIDPEQLIEWDPEYLFVDLGTETYDALEDEEYQSITAIQNGDVYGVPPTRDYSINFGTVLANGYYVGSVLFPEAYDDVDPTAKADAIYEQFVGAPIYDAVAEAYGGGFGKLDRFT
ncbi:ABC transporter substrate-binding protein [Haloarculaceae archaeon H-GB2-1]|nr:ABC transporter substrate-binding protein [Haloarculaceae archaeon H-GB1-1]MEA5388767.1 ABC transporter substrate-binding protein [Haloarculaceae archaeon H-GB11]MEA5406823.1 ABC transporter substrate-binding protein [Haloarculaceae archaeon H-GB2-1]